MKILLNENEMYEIKLPEQIKLQELEMITARFNSLLKNFSRFNLVDNADTPASPKNRLSKEEISEERVYNKEQYNILRENRNLFIELLNTYYNKTPQEFEELIKKNGFTFERRNMSGVHILKLREFHKVNPNEIDLIKFPTRNEQICDLRLIR